MKYQLGTVTRIGNRKENQDSYGSFSNGEALVMVVADGMGGHRGGLLASQTVIRCVASSFEKEQGLIKNPVTFLQKLVLESHAEINRVGIRQQPPIQPRTTAVICLVQAGMAWWAHVGDSRLYLFRQSELMFRTRDHSRIEELMQEGSLTAQQALTHPERHRVTRCLGGLEAIKSISVSKAVPLKMGDMVLLCTDGLWSAMGDQKIETLVNGYYVDDMASKLATEADKRSAPRADNITIILMRWLSASQNILPALKRQAAVSVENPTVLRPPVIDKRPAAAKAPAPAKEESPIADKSPTKSKDDVSDAVDALKAIFDEYKKELK
ncbi:MAG: protein phosphatase 2C domain-containing protein [Gammaproteobacteria bacterium]|nr:protein phosphatase 2C domain-containing protein [Gammaproteobacteria bacterium]MCF6230235.1 protein phosphatase 2C domain-containing protein [Gammaproteobacteria bacterium]